jgi:hypothetical protein
MCTAFNQQKEFSHGSEEEIEGETKGWAQTQTERRRR